MNDLRTLIDVSAGVRLPHYEPEIFSDNDLTDYYLRRLCEQCDWYANGVSVPGMAYRYARFVMKCRWPEAEPVIATSPGPAYYYATYVMKSRWPEAEHIIATDMAVRRWYSQWFDTNI